MRENSKRTIAIPTLTYAIRGESTLNQRGIYNKLIKLPAGSTKRGCGYGLEVDAYDLREALLQLQKAGIPKGEIL